MGGGETIGESTAADSGQAVNKPKRVRTGCLTCRERHLKCDEGLPTCANCRKSSRVCKRGIRLNFIDTTVQAPPVMVTASEWNIKFEDESREIASNYQGGLGRYAALQPSPQTQQQPSHQMDNHMAFDFTSVSQPPTLSQHHPLPQAQGALQETYPDEASAGLLYEPHRPQQHHHHTHSYSESTHSGSTLAQGASSAYANTEPADTPAEGTRDYLNTQEEVLFMQVFVEEVGLWMDSMDPLKHFSRLLPFHALGEPMLLNAFLACGARHLTLVNSKYPPQKAVQYYDKATTLLLRALENRNRNSVICATTAVILNVYEIMCEKPLQRMNHIAGARALLRECGWNARSTGIGGACFWLNIGMELLSCLHFNWKVAWDPDKWGFEMDFSRETESGREEVWTHRILYIVAKIGNFRASVPRHPDPSPRNEQLRLQERYNEWKTLKNLADAWNENIPRTMHPLGYLYPYQTISQSAFPEIWLIKRATIVARLFYHTGMVLLAQVNPLMSPETDEMRELQQRHSNQICGIVAHVKDRGVASVALRSLAIAAECLTTRREQEEVISIFEKITQETGWRVGFLHKELKEKWGWTQEDEDEQQQQQQMGQAPPPVAAMQGAVVYQQAPGLQPQVTMQPPLQPLVTVAAPVPARPRAPGGIVNPLLAAADFNMPQHPYQSYYVPANTLAPQNQFEY